MAGKQKVFDGFIDCDGITIVSIISHRWHIVNDGVRVES